MQFFGGEIKHSSQNNDKHKDNANPQHNKYGFTHCSLTQNSALSELSRWKKVVGWQGNTIRMKTSFN
ncbi:hypothetical protein EGA42_22725 [Salmonella enterica]|nr:hypothetical protein [Salmonella enterica]